MPYQDPTLPHQIRLVYDKAHQNKVRVTCNCLGEDWPNGTITYELMPGFPADSREALAIYGNPSHHRENQGVTFVGHIPGPRRT